MSERLPLFPLGTVLFPGLLLPLHIFEARYRQLVREFAALPDDQPKRFGVVAIKQGRETGEDGVQALYEVGCVADVRQVAALPDGRFDIVTTGSRRFRLHEVDRSQPYLVGVVDYLDEPVGDEAAVLAGAVAKAYLRYRDLLLAARGVPAGGAPSGESAPMPDDPVVLSYLVAAATILDLNDKQRLLEAADARTRLRAELKLLHREAEVLVRLPSLPAGELARQPLSPN